MYLRAPSCSQQRGFDEEREWSRSFWMEEGQERVRESYGAASYDRLRLVKQQYDPDNFFRLNQNIPPA
ncbi:MAG: BBE domain-containing protein [Jiangellaceae bacterium]